MFVIDMSTIENTLQWNSSALVLDKTITKYWRIYLERTSKMFYVGK